MKITNYVERKEWGFEVWEETYDDKGKRISRRQRGAAVHGPAAEDHVRAVALFDPFAANREE